MDCLIASILPVKNIIKFLHTVEDSAKQFLPFGLKTEFKILNKALRLFVLLQIISEK